MILTSVYVSLAVLNGLMYRFIRANNKNYEPVVFGAHVINIFVLLFFAMVPVVNVALTIVQLKKTNALLKEKKKRKENPHWNIIDTLMDIKEQYKSSRLKSCEEYAGGVLYSIGNIVLRNKEDDIMAYLLNSHAKSLENIRLILTEAKFFDYDERYEVYTKTKQLLQPFIEEVQHYQKNINTYQEAIKKNSLDTLLLKIEEEKNKPKTKVLSTELANILVLSQEMKQKNH